VGSRGRYLLLDGPLNGCYASLIEAVHAGYSRPAPETQLAWGTERIMVHGSTIVPDA
jgi:hypothetical protein